MADRRTVKASEARQKLSGLINEVFDRKTRIVIQRSGIPVAAVVSPADLAYLEKMEAEREERFRVLAEMREPFEDVPSEEIEREVERAIAEVRGEKRAEASAGDSM